MRFAVESLQTFAASVLERVGLAADRAQIVAARLIDADLLGFHTHGLVRLPGNVAWIEQGETRVDGDPHVLSDHGAVLNWDAGYLPGPYVMSEAVDTLIPRARELGCAVITIRKSQHVACLAPHVLRAAEAGFAAWAVVATPAESLVTVHNGARPLFSTNPFAFAFPTQTEPIFADMSLAVTSGGKVRQTYQEGRRLPQPMIINKEGKPTDDPAALLEGALLPLGGLDHGYKGYALLLWSELLTTALGGWGRLDKPTDDEANSVMLQLMDPSAFGDPAAVAAQASHIAELCRAVPAREGCDAVRIPGERALANRRDRLEHGVLLAPYIVEPLQALGERLQVAFPAGQ